MPLHTLFDISNENFDHFFAREMQNISAQNRDELPRDILYKLFYNSGRFRPKALHKLNFLGKLFVLWKGLKKSWYIVVEDEQNGIGINDFNELRKKASKRRKDAEQSGLLISGGEFVLANKELSDALGYLNQLSVSPSYNYLIRQKNVPISKAKKWNEEMRYIIQFLCFYESQKKKWINEFGISIPEFLVMMYTAWQDRPIVGSIMYKEIFKQAFQSSPRKIKASFGVLQNKGYIAKTGVSKGATLQITALGRSVLQEILMKYAINC